MARLGPWIGAKLRRKPARLMASAAAWSGTGVKADVLWSAYSQFSSRPQGAEESDCARRHDWLDRLLACQSLLQLLDEVPERQHVDSGLVTEVVVAEIHEHPPRHTRELGDRLES